jgi:hypothetical protein
LRFLGIYVKHRRQNGLGLLMTVVINKLNTTIK